MPLSGITLKYPHDTQWPPCWVNPLQNLKSLYRSPPYLWICIWFIILFQDIPKGIAQYFPNALEQKKTKTCMYTSLKIGKWSKGTGLPKGRSQFIYLILFKLSSARLWLREKIGNCGVFTNILFTFIMTYLVPLFVFPVKILSLRDFWMQKSRPSWYWQVSDICQKS